MAPLPLYLCARTLHLDLVSIVSRVSGRREKEKKSSQVQGGEKKLLFHSFVASFKVKVERIQHRQLSKLGKYCGTSHSKVFYDQVWTHYGPFTGQTYNHDDEQLALGGATALRRQAKHQI